MGSAVFEGMLGALLSSHAVANHPEAILIAASKVLRRHPLALFQEFVHADSPACKHLPVLVDLCLRSLKQSLSSHALLACLRVAASSGSVALLSGVACVLLEEPDALFSDDEAVELTEAVLELQHAAVLAVPAPWTCSVCDMDNAAHDSACVMCAEPKPDPSLRALSLRGLPSDSHETLALALITLMHTALSNLTATHGGSMKSIVVLEAVPGVQACVAFVVDPHGSAVASLTSLTRALAQAQAVVSATQPADAYALHTAITEVCALLDANLSLGAPSAPPDTLVEASRTLTAAHRQCSSGAEPGPHAAAITQTMVTLATAQGGEALVKLLEDVSSSPGEASSAAVLSAVALAFGSNRRVRPREASHIIRALLQLMRRAGPPPVHPLQYSHATSALHSVIKSPGATESLLLDDATALVGALFDVAHGFAKAAAQAADGVGLIAARHAVKTLGTAVVRGSMVVSASVSNHRMLQPCIRACLNVHLFATSPPWAETRLEAHSLRKEALCLLYTVVYNSYPQATQRPDQPVLRCMHVVQHDRVLYYLLQFLRNEDSLRHCDETRALLAAGGKPLFDAAEAERSRSVSMIVFLLRAAIGRFGPGLDTVFGLAPPEDEGSTRAHLPRNHNSKLLTLAATTSTLIADVPVQPGSCTSEAEVWYISRPHVRDARVASTAPTGPALVPPLNDGKHTPFRSLGDVLLPRHVLEGANEPTAPGCVVVRGENACAVTTEWESKVAGTTTGAPAQPCMVAAPLSFHKVMAAGEVAEVDVWLPQAPPGYAAVGCVVTKPGATPSTQDVWCLHGSVVEADRYLVPLTPHRAHKTLHTLSCLSKSFVASPSAGRLALSSPVPVSSLPSNLIPIVNDMLATALVLALPRPAGPYGRPPSDSPMVAVALIQDVMSCFSGLSMASVVGVPTATLAHLSPKSPIAMLQHLERPGSVVAIGSMFHTSVYADTFVPSLRLAVTIMRKFPLDADAQRYAMRILRFIGMPRAMFMQAIPNAETLELTKAALMRFRNDAELQQHGLVLAAFLTHQMRPSRLGSASTQALYKDAHKRYGGKYPGWPTTKSAEEAALVRPTPRKACTIS